MEDELKMLYFDWIKDETNNYTLTGDEGGIKLALKLLCEIDPMEFFTDRDVVSESIEGMSQTFKVNDDGMPLKVMKWIRPYYMVGSI